MNTIDLDAIIDEYLVLTNKLHQQIACKKIVKRVVHQVLVLASENAAKFQNEEHFNNSYRPGMLKQSILDIEKLIK